MRTAVALVLAGMVPMLACLYLPDAAAAADGNEDATACPPRPAPYDGTDPVVAELRDLRTDQADACETLRAQLKDERSPEHNIPDQLRSIEGQLRQVGTSTGQTSARLDRELRPLDDADPTRVPTLYDLTKLTSDAVTERAGQTDPAAAVEVTGVSGDALDWSKTWLVLGLAFGTALVFLLTALAVVHFWRGG